MEKDLKTTQPPSLKSQTRQANWHRANLRKYTAHLAVRRALASGTLQKYGCEVCGHGAVDAHHDRSDEPLSIQWLCRRHHVKVNSLRFVDALLGHFGSKNNKMSACVMKMSGKRCEHVVS